MAATPVAHRSIHDSPAQAGLLLWCVRVGSVSAESSPSPLVPAEAGTQRLKDKDCMPACAGMSGDGVRVNANGTRF
jgi:hypothetical protein